MSSGKALPVGGFVLSAAGMTALVWQMLAVTFPDGDPEKARQAAQLLRQLATRVDASEETATDAANSLGQHNLGAGVTAFEKYFWTEIAPYPVRLSAYLRGLADAVDDYADMLAQVQHALHSMAITQWLELLMFFCWPAIDKKVRLFIDWAERKAQARLLTKIFEHTVGKRLLYATGGTTAYTVLDQLIVDGVKGARGEDMGSWGDRGAYMLKNFAACMVFYNVDPANFGKHAFKILPKNEAAQNAVVFVAGSTVFSITGNALNNPGAVVDDPQNLLPTWQQMLVKLSVAGGQDQFRRWQGYYPSAPRK
ncbi:hypothetical protein AB0F17_00275 [Nonomuraea sp. NPDC026600]|uniref:hypothetical protein n=1 Tax=Nonomuraea sp. NPDC026600 TaxID=3155363 RepID=UPI00340AFFEF